MNNQGDRRPEIIVVGGGFAGINFVRGLKQAPVSIVLVDQHNYHLFQPLLYQVATAELSADDIASPIRNILRRQKNVRVAMTEIVGVDLDRKLVLGHRSGRRYDYLVLATGVTPTFYGNEEIRDQAPGLKNLDDALEIRRRILLAFEEAEFEADDDSRQGKLTFVVVGGGPTGVELSGAIMETATRTLPQEFRDIDTTTARVILVQGGNRLLKSMPEAMGRRALKDLQEMGVDVRLASLVTSVDSEGVYIGEERVLAENVFWAAGVKGTAIAHTLGVELNRQGQIIVGPDLSIPGYPEVFAVGDAAQVIDEKTGQPVPAVAQGAIQMGRFAAGIIRREVEANSLEDRPAFSYHDKGSMATIGRGRGLASVNGRTLGGFMGWMAWGVVHMAFLVGFRSKIMVMTEWLWNYIFAARRSRLITGDPKLNIKQVRGAWIAGENEEHVPD
jgi:NADH dehydrogenase